MGSLPLWKLTPTVRRGVLPSLDLAVHRVEQKHILRTVCSRSRPTLESVITYLRDVGRSPDHGHEPFSE